MIRYRVRELLADRVFRERRVITLGEVANATGLHRATLSKICNVPDYVTRTDVVDKLCTYFGCSVSDLMEHVRDTGDSV